MSILRFLTLCSLASVLALTQTGRADYSAIASITLLPNLEPERPQPARLAAMATVPSAGEAPIEVIFPDPGPRNRAAFAALRLKAGLNQDMLNNFDLFLYV